MISTRHQAQIEAREALKMAALASRPFRDQAQYDSFRKTVEYRGTDKDALDKKAKAIAWFMDQRDIASDILDPNTTNKAAIKLREKMGSVQVGVGRPEVIASYDVTVGDFDVDMSWMQLFTTASGASMIATGEIQVMTTTSLFTVKEQLPGKPLEFSPIAKESFITMDSKTFYVAIAPNTDWLSTNGYAKANDLFVKMRSFMEAKKASNLYTAYNEGTSGTQSFATDLTTTINNAVITLRARLDTKGYQLTAQTPFVLAGNTKWLPTVMAALRNIQSETGNRKQNVEWPIIPVFSDYINAQFSSNDALVLSLPGRNMIYAPVKAMEQYQLEDVETETSKLWVREKYGYKVNDTAQNLVVRLSA